MGGFFVSTGRLRGAAAVFRTCQRELASEVGQLRARLTPHAEAFGPLFDCQEIAAEYAQTTARALAVLEHLPAELHWIGLALDAAAEHYEAVDGAVIRPQPRKPNT